MFGRKRKLDDFSAEIEAHLQLEIERLREQGLSEEEAQAAARRRFGNVTLAREHFYESHRWLWWDHFWQDVRYGLRLLRRSPGFTAVAILSLALGIGANTAIFELADAVRYRAIPVKEASQLAIVKIGNNFDDASGEFTSRYPLLTYGLWQQIQAHQEAFSKIFVWSARDFNLARGGQKRFAHGIWVSGEFFETLGVQPLVGHLLTPQDDQPGCGGIGAVISHAFWQREYGGSESVLGKQITLDGYPAEIIGVTPANFYGIEVGKTFDVAVPVCSEAVIRGEWSRLNVRHAWWLAAMGRLKPGWTIEKASAQMAAISRGAMQETLPQGYDAGTAKKYLAFKLAAFPAENGYSELRDDSEPALQVLMGIAGLVLFVACANLANFMLARGSAREREMAMRLAMGAPRSRLIRQLLSESLLLMAVGAGLGIVLAHQFSRVLLSMTNTEHDPIFLMLSFDWRVLAFTTALAVATLLLFGLVPALHATEAAPGVVLKSGGRDARSGRQRRGLRRMLVISQVALSLVLLVGALMFVRTLRNLLMLDPGFQPHHLLLTRLDFSHLKLPKGRRTDFKEQLAERARGILGVEAAAEVQNGPVTGDGWDGSVLSPNSDHEIAGTTDRNRVSPGYFHAMETPLLAGREFNETDTLKSPSVAIVNQAFVTKFLNRANPLGKTARLEAPPGQPPLSYEIVGVVKNVKYMALREEFPPTIYFPLAQDEDPGDATELVIRSRLPTAEVAAELRSTMAAVRPDIEINSLTYDTLISESLTGERVMATLSTFFGTLALLLAAIGLYGVISYMVTRRTNEIGIRMTLGAQRGDILWMVVREAGKLLVAGVVLGTGLALAVATTVRSLLFGLKPNDPVTIALGVCFLAVIALASSVLPARRAARLDPMAALRHE
jgi:putative ABC transport system permease protein